MKEGLKDWITDIAGVGLWILANYKMFFTEEGLNIWVYLGIMATGALFLALSIKQIGRWIKQISDKIVKKKLG